MSYSFSAGEVGEQTIIAITCCARERRAYSRDCTRDSVQDASGPETGSLHEWSCDREQHYHWMETTSLSLDLQGVVTASQTLIQHTTLPPHLLHKSGPGQSHLQYSAAYSGTPATTHSSYTTTHHMTCHTLERMKRFNVFCS